MVAAVGVLALAALATATTDRVANAARRDTPVAAQPEPASPGSSAAADPATARPAPSSAEPPDLAPASVSPAALSTRLSALFGPGDSYSVAGVNLSTGRSISAGAAAGMTEASVIKLDILQAALYQSQQGNSFDQGEAELMMDNSDNVAADQVFDEIGGNPGLQSYNDRLGLVDTSLDPDGSWGLSTTAAMDQITLLKALVSGSSPLTLASRQDALSLMGDVEADQDWGVSTPADAATTSKLKNGWLSVDGDDGRWAVNSVGVITAAGDQLVLAVLSQHQPDYQSGVDRVEAAARLLAQTLT